MPPVKREMLRCALNRFLVVGLLALGHVATDAALASAQATADAPERNWSNSTELSWVLSKGNANASSFSVRNVYRYTWAEAQFYWEVGVLRASSVDEKFALGTEDDFEVVTPQADLDHNRAVSKFRYGRELNDRWYWYLAYDSSRDEPANINIQLIGSAGVGNEWYNREGLMLRTAYGLNYTFEDLDFEGGSKFGGYRLLYHLEFGAGENTTLASELTFDGSWETADDLRADSLNSVSVAMSEVLALRGSLRLLFRNVPALDEIDLLDPASGDVVGSVIIPKARLDTAVSMALVLDF